MPDCFKKTNHTVLKSIKGKKKFLSRKKDNVFIVAVAAYIITSDGKLILVKDHRGPVGTPGGWVDPVDISPEVSVYREVAEELNIVDHNYLKRALRQIRTYDFVYDSGTATRIYLFKLLDGYDITSFYGPNDENQSVYMVDLKLLVNEPNYVPDKRCAFRRDLKRSHFRNELLKYTS